MNLHFNTPPAPQPQLPTPTLLDRAGRALDRFLGVFNPEREKARMEARRSNDVARLAYHGAFSGRDRAPAPPFQAPNSPLNQMGANAMLRRANDQEQNNSFVNTLVGAIVDFTVGSNIDWIPAMKNDAKVRAYRDYLRRWQANADARGNHHFVDMIRMGLSGTVFQGTHGFVHHYDKENHIFQISAVRGQNIGNPLVTTLNPTDVQGVVVDPNTGRILGFNLFKQLINNQFVHAGYVPNSMFSYLNPVVTDDDLKNVTLLKTILNDTHDMHRLELALMKKIQWAASKTALVNLPNGSPPVPYNTDYLGEGGQRSSVMSRAQELVHGETMYGEPGMNIDVPRNETPTDQEMEFLEYKMQQIAGVLGIPLPFLYLMVGASVPGTLTRSMSKRAERTFREGRIGQKWLKRVVLEEVILLALFAGINRGEIPYDEEWNRGDFVFTAHPTTDVGNESDAMLNENRQGVTTRMEICGAKGMFYGDVDDQIYREGKRKIVDSIRMSQEIEVETGVKVEPQYCMVHLQLMTPNGNENSTPAEKPEEKAGAPSKSGDNAGKPALAK